MEASSGPVVPATAPAPRVRGDANLPWIFAGGAFLLHLLFLMRYGIFRDELYYLACADHMAWGYVDHPPLSISALWLTRAVLGDALWAIRLPPALALAAVVGLTGWLAREAGGGKGAQALAMLAALVAPYYLAVGHFFSMNAFDVLLWTAVFCVLSRLLRAPRPALWFWFGALLGLGLLNKLSMLWLIAGVGVGLLATPQRRLFLTPGPWLAAAVTALLYAPHIAWQVANGWPTLEFIHNATTQKMAPVSPIQFILSQLLLMNPIAAPIWIAGLVWPLASWKADRWVGQAAVSRVAAVAYLVILLILVVNGKSRAEYLAPAYPPLLATGAAWWERLWRARRSRWLPRVAFAAVALLGVAAAPFGLPALPVQLFIRYQHALHVEPTNQEKGPIGVLPQFYADMFGWEELAAAVAAVYHRLPAAEQVRCAIYASNYGEAGAVDYFGRRYGLPRAICSHNNYWLWGPRNWDGQTLIVVNTMSAKARREFGAVEQAAMVSNPLSMPFEVDVPVYVAHRLKQPVALAWAGAKNYR